VDFIDNVLVNTGGFSAKYGNVLSSVLDVSYREGNRDEFDMQLDLNFTGLSGIVEGPIGSNKGSWMFSAKHSFTDILFKIIDTDQEPVIYDELQGKVVFDISSEHRLSIIDIFGTDRWKVVRNEAIDRSDNWYGNFNMMENVLGLNWRYIWSDNGFSNTSVSHSWIRNNIKVYKTNTQEEAFLNYSSEHEIAIRNVNHLQFNAAHRLDFGVETSTTMADYDNLFAESINQMGQVSPMLKMNNQIRTWKTGVFLEYSWNPIDRLNITPGLRWDYFSYNKKMHLSPRLSVSYKIDEYTTITGATGIFYQHVPMYFLSQSDDFKNLSDIKSYHVVLGTHRLITEDIKLTLEIYSKNYQRCPMDPNQPSLFILDENIYNQFYGHHKHIISEGTANVKGVELMLQKKMSNKLYGLISFTYYQSTYYDLNGQKHNRITDNRILSAIEAGYKPDNEWEFSFRYSYAGGIPYTPFNHDASIIAGVGIYDATKIMSERLPPYSCLSVRVDRRFYFKSSTLIIYLSIWNLLNRENVSYHYWDEYGENAGNYTQWPMLPVLGIEYEF
jgi:outer membrane receptor for ferrienterochelin and colicin